MGCRNIGHRRAPFGTPFAWHVAIAVWMLMWVPAVDWTATPAAASLPPASGRAIESADQGRAQNVAGKILVASRGLTDPNFAESVVLLTDHGAGGTVGLIVNARTTVPIAKFFGHLTLTKSSAEPAYFGGPVAPATALALVRSVQPVEGARRVAGDIHVVSTRERLEALLTAGRPPSEFRVYLGHAGWSPGQLQREMSLNAWHVADADAEVVFDANPDTIWLRQIRRAEALQAAVQLPTVRYWAPKR